MKCPSTAPKTGCSSCNPGGTRYGGYASSIITDDDGQPLGSAIKTPRGDACSISQAAKDVCWLDETLESAAVAAGADTVFSLQVKWWWQIQEFVNVGDQTAETFSLTSVTYGQSTYFLTAAALAGSTVDGVAYGAPNGIDVRKWNLDADNSHYYPVPAMGLNDAVTLTFNNGAVGAEDLAVIAGGPAVLQIG